MRHVHTCMCNTETSELVQTPPHSDDMSLVTLITSKQALCERCAGRATKRSSPYTFSLVVPVRLRAAARRAGRRRRRGRW